MNKPDPYKEYAIKIRGSIWTGDYPNDQWVFDTYEEAAKA